MKRKIVLIGPGRLGQAVTRLLGESDHDIRAVISRDVDRAVSAARFIGRPGIGTTDLAAAADGEVVLLALPDDHLESMAALLRREGHLAQGAVLIHFSGLHPAACLLGEDAPTVEALSIHPLQTFADAVMGIQNLPGTPCTIEGTEHLMPLAKELVEDIGGTAVRIRSETKPLYHAAACVASNYLVTLVATARQILAACGFDEDEALHLLIPLLRGTGRNLAALGPERALTGPIARGDDRTVALHLKALAQQPADLQEIYRVMGTKTVEVALRKGTLDETGAKRILALLRGC